MQAARRVLERAKQDAPVGDPEEDPDPSTSLRDSGRIDRERRSVLVVFDTPYAAKQELDQRLKHPRGGKAHYLSDALKQEIPKLEGIVASAVRKRL